MSSATAPVVPTAPSAAAAFDGNGPRLSSVPGTGTGPGPVAGGPRHGLTELPEGVEVQRAVSKGVCPITAADFMDRAEDMVVTFGAGGKGGTYYAVPKVFSTGKFGWYLTGKLAVAVGVPLSLQLGCNLVVIGATMTADDFMTAAKPLTVTIGVSASDGQALSAHHRTFSTGSFGWNASGKVVVMVGTEPLTVQVGLNAIVIGSKDAA